MKRATPSRRGGSRGVALIEALVGVLIFSVGVLGLVGLQASMSRAQGSAKFRADAAYLASDLLGQMWADQQSLARYDSAECATYSRCSDWVQKVSATLPASETSVTVGSGNVAVTITWSTTSEGTHSYVLETAIR